ncbi:MAG: transposase [Sandarakinorhabdus sp.]|nr:transposase [Sandarakinorhabdus sp.]
MEADWRSELDSWLAPFAAALRNKTRRRLCPAYIAGLIGPGDRKSVQPMAARSDEVSYDRLHHFVGSGVWDEAPFEAALLVEPDRLVGGDDPRHRHGGTRRGTHHDRAQPLQNRQARQTRDARRGQAVRRGQLRHRSEGSGDHPAVAINGSVSKLGKRRKTVVDRRTTRHPGYAVSLAVCKRIEEAFGWAKTIGGDCQDFRVWAGIMGRKESHYVPTQGAGDSG